MSKLPILAALILSSTISARGAITGTVTDPDAKPIAGATIRAYVAEGSDAMRARLVAGKADREPVASVQSAENGSFSIELKKSPAAIDVTVEAPSRARITVATVDGDDLGAIVLAAPQTRMMRVTSGGKPVASALVVSGLESWRTNASGEVPAISSAVFVVHPDYAVLRREATTLTEVKLTRGVSVRGRVVKGSDPVAHATVSINGWPLAETGEDGTFSIAHAPDNWQSMTAAHGSDVGSASRSKVASVEIRLAAGLTFTGTLRDAKRGAAVAGARMALSGSDDSSSVVALSDAKGSFTFSSLLPRQYQVSGMHPDYAVESAGVTLPATRSRSFTAQPFARARGHVVDEDHKPVAGALVSSVSSSSTRTRSVMTSAAGAFTMRVAPGSSVPTPIYASKRDYVNGASVSRVWRPGDVRDDVVITLARGFVAQVRVLDRKERPVPNAQVNISHSAGQSGERAPAIACADPSLPDCYRTSQEGIVAVRTSEGRHDLMVFGEDVAPARVPNQLLTARAASVVVHVDRGVEISGKVVLADGTPVAGAIVESPTTLMPRSAISAADGTFRIAGAAAGSSTVTAFSSDRRLSSVPLAVNAPASDVTITIPRGARVEGRILDRATQQPVTDFTVLLPPRRNAPAGAFSSFAGGQPIHADDGRYAIDNVPPGTLQLMVRASGYVPATHGDITVEDGKTTSGIDIQLDRGVTVSGRVTAAGSPVSGAQVRLAFQRTPGFSNATTDADGLYTLEGMSEGDHTFEFQKSGFIVLRKPLTLAAGKDMRLDVELDPGQELRGRVVDHSGHGVAAANIATVGGDGRPFSSVTSDGDGAFVLQGLADGKYKLVARKDGFVSGEANDVTLPGSGPVTLTLETGATITGRVTGLPPEQLTRVVVSAYGNTTRGQTFVDASGNFTLTGMPNGSVRVDAMLSGAGQLRTAPYKMVSVENGSAPPVEINFEEGITVTGRVTRAGAPVSNGGVMFMPANAAPRGAAPTLYRQMVNAMVSADGSYVASGLSAGDYDVHVNAPGLAFSAKYTASVNGTFDIDIRGALLRGRVVDGANAGPVANARVSLSSRLPSFGTAATDSDGRFVVEGLADATYTMNVASDQYAPSSQQLVIANGATPEVEIRLEQAPVVIIHLTDATSGSPVEGSVVVTDAGRGYNGQAARIDGGTFKVWLKPGSYHATAYARGYLTEISTFTTPPADVTIALSRGGALRIRARSAQLVRLDVPGGATQRVLGPIQAGMNGPYEGLLPGSYLLTTFETGRSAIRSTPVTIVAGETATIEVP